MRRNPGGRPPHGPGPWGVPGPGGATVDREAPEEMELQKMGIHIRGGGKRGGRVQGDGIIKSEKVEHGQAVHSYGMNSIPL